MKNSQLNNDIRNYQTTIRGTLTHERDGDLVTYKLIDAQYWCVTKQTWMSLSPDPDKFQVTTEDFETSRTEFWARFKQYVRTRFNRYILTEFTHI